MRRVHQLHPPLSRSRDSQRRRRAARSSPSAASHAARASPSAAAPASPSETTFRSSAQLLASGKRVVAMLASEYVAALHPLEPAEVERRLEALGFAAVETTVLGEEIVAAAYERVHSSAGDAFPRLRSTCPVVVSWVERFYPQLTHALAPVVPPYIAQARLVREIYPDDTAIVYVSPCWARKDEVHDPQFAGVVDVAIGFDELQHAPRREPRELQRRAGRVRPLHPPASAGQGALAHRRLPAPDAARARHDRRRAW